MNETTNERTCMACGCVDEDLFEVCIDGEDKVLCADCLHNLGYYRCDDCGELFPMDEAVTVNSGTRQEAYVCESCADDNYYRCDDCESYYSSMYTHQDNFGNVVCDDCYDRHWYTCESCGRLIQSDEAYWDEDAEEYFCADCISSRRSGAFHGYGYKPDPEFKYRSGEARREDHLTTLLTFGVELEVDKGRDHLTLTNELAKLGQPIYMKHDGSLGEEGVEIVTHPCSLAYHQYDLRWAEISRQCRHQGYTSHEAGTCGLHIHIGRRQMGEDYEAQRRTAGNLVLLAYQLQTQLINFSRRTKEQLDDWARMPDLEGRGYRPECSYRDIELTELAMGTSCYGRYQAVNLCNSETVELRFFRGTLKRDTIIASLQLASNLTKFAMTHTPTECIHAEWADVVGIEQFKELNAYCQSRGL